MRFPRRPVRLVGAFVAVTLLAACGSDDGADEFGADEFDEEFDDEFGVDDGADTDDGAAADESPGFDEIDCSEDALTGGDDGFAFTSAHVVIDGELGEVCFGTEDPVIVDAWNSLATITPAGQLGDLTIFAGFEPDGDGEADTLAFVNALDADGTQFQMSVNTVDAVADPDELLLTLAHEFTHVFTATSTQLDRTDEAIDDCDTYFNGDGCYLPDSLLLAWIDEFWAGPVLDGVDPFEDSFDDADARCADDDGFFGPYAATNPEEDFAEAFSAYVFDLEPLTDGQAQRLDWLGAQPGLAEFAERALDAGFTPLANNFEPCGF